MNLLVFETQRIVTILTCLAASLPVDVVAVAAVVGKTAISVSVVGIYAALWRKRERFLAAGLRNESCWPTTETGPARLKPRYSGTLFAARETPSQMAKQ